MTSSTVLTPECGAYWLPHATFTSSPMVLFNSTPTIFAIGATPSMSMARADGVGASDSRNHGDEITGNLLVIL